MCNLFLLFWRTIEKSERQGFFFIFFRIANIFPRYSSKLLAKIVRNARYRPVEILFVAFQITATLKLLDFAYKHHNGETFL